MSERKPDDLERPEIVNSSRRCFLRRSAQLAGGLALASLQSVAAPAAILATEEKPPSSLKTG